MWKVTHDTFNKSNCLTFVIFWFWCLYSHTLWDSVYLVYAVCYFIYEHKLKPWNRLLWKSTIFWCCFCVWFPDYKGALPGSSILLLVEPWNKVGISNPQIYHTISFISFTHKQTFHKSYYCVSWNNSASCRPRPFSMQLNHKAKAIISAKLL